MRFMMLMIPKVYSTPDAPELPGPEAIAEMMKYNEELVKAGVLLALDGLHPPVRAARVQFGEGRPRVIDGPFSEVKETVGGYWLLQVKSRAEAVEWASRCPASPGDVIEVRQVHDLSDFPAESVAEISPALQAIAKA